VPFPFQPSSAMCLMIREHQRAVWGAGTRQVYGASIGRINDWVALGEPGEASRAQAARDGLGSDGGFARRTIGHSAQPDLLEPRGIPGDAQSWHLRASNGAI